MNDVTLSPKEVEVLLLFSEGLSLAEIAAATDRSRSTIKNHCANVHRKLGVHSTAEAVAVAIREGYLVAVGTPSPSRKDRSVPATIRRESRERSEGDRQQGTSAPTTLRSPMTKGREGRRAAIMAVLSREGLL